MPSSLSSLINLSNSIIGVSLLTMPYCFQQCGILLSCVVLALSTFINKYACHLLLKAAMLTRRRKLEYLAYQTLGYNGKLLIELGLICFLLGGCVALFVVAGDLLPALLSSGVAQESRVYLMVFLAFFVALPLSLRRNTESLTSFSLISMLFYVFLAIKMFFDSLPALLNGSWFHRVVWWNTDNLLAILPIFAMALAGQPQVFEVFDLGAIDVPQMRVLDRTVSSAMHTCLTVYAVVGFCGYIGQYQRDAPLPGNSLLLLDDSWMSWMFKLGFVASLIMSFPLCLFPCRTSLHSVIYRRNAKLHEVSSSLHDFIPENRFKLLTFVLLTSTLGAALLIPRIELFLGITGATIGCVVCLVAPARIFLGAANGTNQTNALEGLMAQFVVLLGLVIMALCSFSMINRLHQPEAFSPVELNDNGNGVNIHDNAMHKMLKGFPLESRTGGIVTPIVKNQKQEDKATMSKTIAEMKAPLVEKENKRIEFPDHQKEVREVRTVPNKTIGPLDTVKHHVGNKNEEPAGHIVYVSDLLDIKPLSKPDISVNVDKINIANGKQSVTKAETVMEQSLPPPLAVDTARLAGASNAPKTGVSFSPDSLRVRGGKKDKDEIKLLEKIAEVQQEQKRMIEDIQKELKQEIALHKEIKTNHSKENEFVELFEEKMKRIDKHIKDADKIGNKTMKDAIGAGNINTPKEEPWLNGADKKRLGFKGPLKILNNRIQEQAKNAANTPAKTAETKLATEVGEQTANIHGQEVRLVETISIPVKPQMKIREVQNPDMSSKNSPQNPQKINEKEIASINQIVIPSREQALDEQPVLGVFGVKNYPLEAPALVRIRQAESAVAPGDLIPQKLAENSKKLVIVPVEKPALLSEVKKDQGPALMKDLDKSIKQDKQAYNKKNNAGKNEEAQEDKIYKDEPKDKKSQERHKREDSVVVRNNNVNEKSTNLEEKKEEYSPKVDAAPLVVKMNPAANNVSKKEAVHKEI
ncbi:putative sodium-coupled neutral amino acid transporter 10 isoform X1 [Varroa jacobsoni]|uniref:putative sodium-coupled neutral amino acid transporter 10 isoform X1 n=2 Tax=Varroa jacobsoni TaxID=62625 RepID=UPI000BFA6954|nr:putative sodium-coupled neutral amino acid transporter 10 isoform X1 [Varroa jacobsoni]